MKNKEKINFTKLTLKKGISLITLVVTIIVIIILASVVVMSLNNNDIITNASNARYESDRDTMQTLLEMTIQKIAIKHKGSVKLITGSVNKPAKDVNSTTGEIIWESKKNPKLTGKIIFGEGEDTETTFYTGKELPVYGGGTTWYLDEDNKLSLKVAGLEMGGTIYDEYEVDKIEVPVFKEFSWHIYTCEQLKFLADFVNNGNALTDKQKEFVVSEGYNEADIVLTAETVVYLEKDLDFGARERGGEWETEENERIKWTPIGITQKNMLISIFEGNNHVIKGIYVNQEENFAGLFGNSSTIKNLTIKDSYIKGITGTGGIVGVLRNGVVENCHNKNTTVILKEGEYRSIGGIAGQAQGNIINCSNNGNIISYGYDENGFSRAGGIVGVAYGEILNCHNIGKTMSAGGSAGGIAGSIMSLCKISNCYNMGEVSSERARVAGIVGGSNNLTEIVNCYNTGKITGTSYYTAGIVGLMSHSENITNSIVQKCYNSGEITGNIYTGGIVGLIGGTSGQGTVINCYNKGKITGTTYTGALIGRQTNQTGLNTLNNLYYLNTIGIGAIDGADDEANNMIGVAEDIASYEEFLTWIENK